MKKKKFPNIGGYIASDKQTLREIDYLEKLSESELQWLSQFTDEYYNANFSSNTPIISNKAEQREINRQKQRRLKSLENKSYHNNSITGETILTPMPNSKKKNV